LSQSAQGCAYRHCIKGHLLNNHPYPSHHQKEVG
jgi:hypothetical protein